MNWNSFFFSLAPQVDWGAFIYTELGDKIIVHIVGQEDRWKGKEIFGQLKFIF